MFDEEWTEKDLAKLKREEPQPMEYISTVETAKLIRIQLKKHFPAIKFRVRCNQYSMGSSIDIYWTDGPTKKKVDDIVKPFCGGAFDGMIDLAYNVQSWLLPDGSAAFGKSQGTGGSRGSDPGYDYPKPHPDARLVDFAPDHIFTHRSYGELSMLKAVLTVHEKYGLPLLNVKMTEHGPELEGDLHARLPNAQSNYWDNREIVHRELQEMDCTHTHDFVLDSDDIRRCACGKSVGL